MILKKVIQNTFEIKTEKQAQKLICEKINAFCETENDDVWGEIVLLFDDHQEVYDVDDCYDDLVDEEDNHFDELVRRINIDNLIGTIYVHYDDEFDREHVTCGISSVYLKAYIAGNKFYTDTNVEFEYDNMRTGKVIGEPCEVTRWVDYNKGKLYSDDLIKKFNLYMGEKDQYSHFCIPMTFDSWGDCEVFVYNPSSIKKLFKKTVKNDYMFFILESGELIIATALSNKYTMRDDIFVRECGERGSDLGREDIFQTGFYFKNDYYLFACLSTLTVIDAIKYCKGYCMKKQDDSYDDSLVFELVKSNMDIYIDYIEDYCNSVCRYYPR